MCEDCGQPVRKKWQQKYSQKKPEAMLDLHDLEEKHGEDVLVAAMMKFLNRKINDWCMHWFKDQFETEVDNCE